MTAEAALIDEREAPPALLEIIHAARAGNHAAFEEIMLLTERHVARIAWRILGDKEEVKEAAQDTFLRLFRHFGQYDEKHDFVAWLSRIACNVCRDMLRLRKRRRIFEPLENAPPAVSKDRAADDDLIRRDDLALLHQAIDTLAPKERMVVLLRDVEGLGTHEVAAALGKNVVTVRVQLSRARVKLRRLLQSWSEGRKP